MAATYPQPYKVKPYDVNRFQVSLLNHQPSTGRSTPDLDTFGLGTGTLGRYTDPVYSTPAATQGRRGPLSLACAWLMAPGPFTRMACQILICADDNGRLT